MVLCRLFSATGVEGCEKRGFRHFASFPILEYHIIVANREAVHDCTYLLKTFLVSHSKTAVSYAWSRQTHVADQI
jgi:hypothetical protein